MKIKTQYWWYGLVILGFIFMISMFQIDSYAADKYHLNGMWWAIASVTGLGAVVCLIKAVKAWGGGGS